MVSGSFNAFWNFLDAGRKQRGFAIPAFLRLGEQRDGIDTGATLGGTWRFAGAANFQLESM